MMRPLLIAMLIGLGPAALAQDRPAPTRSLYLQLIHQARADGRPRAALAYLDDFERQYPGDPDARILRINSLIDLGQIGTAEAIPLPSGNSGDAVRGHLLAARGHWAEAIPFYQAATQASPADPLLRNALGYALLRSGRAMDAIETFRGAIDLAPQAEVIRNNLLLALTIGGQQAEAETTLRQIRDSGEQAALRQKLAAEAARINRKGS